ncbi:uncharacterized protein LOC130199917 [Pseudoliparis swirei]|uniref:uncharacterized protein LOC130199917 n=1 Tax=Pseudoliparis swirei TaxID=2059687 RepID=UPI0024BEF571|nr:uncharacterized protein LOC130199917 [Pseudoliparis swirei]
MAQSLDGNAKEVPISQTVEGSPTSPARALPADERENVHSAESSSCSIQGESGKPTHGCICAENRQVAVVAGTAVRAVPHSGRGLASSVVAAIKHVITPVCTWKRADVDSILVEARKMAWNVTANELAAFLSQNAVFGKNWDVDLGKTAGYSLQGLDDETVVKGKLEELLDRDGMCLLSLNGAVSVVVKHDKYIVVVDCGVRSASGMSATTGASVAVFNSGMADLMYHIRPLQKSLNADRCAIRSISVRERLGETACLATLTSLSVNPVAHAMSVSCDGDNSDDMDAEATSDVIHYAHVVSSDAGSSDVVVEAFSDDTHAVNDRPARCNNDVMIVRGSFHQGDDRFEFPGVQCMAIALVTVDILKRWLLTPFNNPQSAEERNYNTRHSQARAVVERSIGLLKGRLHVPATSQTPFPMHIHTQVEFNSVWM